MTRLPSAIAILFVVAALVSAQDDPPKDGPLAGVYHLHGTENGKSYYGVMVVHHEDGSEVVRTVSIVNDAVAYGVGHVKGDVISLAWKSPISVGVTTYTLSKDKKKWDGRWTGRAGGEFQDEQAVFIRKVNGKEL